MLRRPGPTPRHLNAGLTNECAVPPDGGAEPVIPGEGHKNDHGGVPWNGTDIAGAVGLTLTASTVAVTAGLFAEALYDRSGAGSTLALLATALVAFALSLAIIRLTGLPTVSGVKMLGFAVIADVAIRVVSGTDDSRILGVPPSFVESALLSGIPFGIAWLYISRKRGRPLRDIGFVAPNSPNAFPLALGAWFTAYIGVVLWALLVTDIETISPPDNATPALETAGGSIIVAWLLVGLWGPFVEEVFFRGFLLSGMRGRLGPWPAILLSSGVFALFHIHPGLYVPTFLLGVAFGWVYLKTRSIWPAIFAHTLHNTIVLIALWQEIG